MGKRTEDAPTLQEVGSVLTEHPMLAAMTRIVGDLRPFDRKTRARLLASVATLYDVREDVERVHQQTDAFLRGVPKCGGKAPSQT